MKLFVIFSVLLVTVLATPFIEPSVINEDNFEDLHNYFKIAAGKAAKKGENLDFCFFSSSFFQKNQICGCFVLDDLHVVTSARCVIDFTESLTVNVTVNFPQQNGKESVRLIEQIFIPDGVNGDAAIEKYDLALDTPQTTIAPNNMAVIKLAKKLKMDEKKLAKASPLTAETVEAAIMQMTAAKYKYRACGVGAINNNLGRPKGVMCTDVNVVASDKCFKAGTTETLDVPENIICVQWADRENNLCIGDYGGPIYAYKANDKDQVTEQKVFCVAVGSPDVKQNAHCLDGHTTFCQFLYQDALKWANAVALL